MIQYLSLLSPLLPILAFLLFCLREKKLPLWVIFAYTVVSFSTDLYTSESHWGREHQILMWNIFTTSEFAIFILFFYLILPQVRIRYTIFLIIFAYLAIALIFSGKSGEDFNSIMSAVNAVAFLVLSIIYFIQQFGSNDYERALPLPIFIVVAGIMISLASTFFLYLISSKLTEAQKDRYWSLNAAASILTNVIFAIAFILNRFQTKNPGPESHTPDSNGPPNNW